MLKNSISILEEHPIARGSYPQEWVRISFRKAEL